MRSRCNVVMALRRPHLDTPAPCAGLSVMRSGATCSSASTIRGAWTCCGRSRQTRRLAEKARDEHPIHSTAAGPSTTDPCGQVVDVTDSVTPMKRRNRLVADALVAAAVAMEDLARRAGMSSSALRRYRLGDRTPSSRVLQRLGGTLREQAEQLQNVADQLEEEASRGGIERR